MAVEIERKFLVDGDAWRNAARERMVMRQGYLGGDRCSIRVRIAEDSANLNLKSRELGCRRLEFEYEIPRDEAEELLESLASGHLVEKIRHLVDQGGLTWEVDEFVGANEGLIVAEVELDHEDQAIDLPDWVGQEVTDDERYYNARLARRPFSEWEQP